MGDNNENSVNKQHELLTTISFSETQQSGGKSWSRGTRNCRQPSQWHRSSIMPMRLKILTTALARSYVMWNICHRNIKSHFKKSYDIWSMLATSGLMWAQCMKSEHEKNADQEIKPFTICNLLNKATDFALCL